MMGLTADETYLINKLKQSGMSIQEATLAIVMVTRQHARLESELTDIVRDYPNLENASIAKETISKLKNLGWLVESKSYGQILTHQSEDLKEKIATTIGDLTIVQKLEMMRANLEDYIQILGPMHDRDVLSSFSGLISQAQRSINLPMLASSPNLSEVPIIQERARNGVEVRVLLGSPEVVVKLRGENTRQKSVESIKGWKEKAKGIPKMKIRIAHSVEDMIIATCASIDDRFLRFDIYDPFEQRSLQGIMVQIVSPSGLNLNLVHLFLKYFNAAWNRGQPLGKTEKLVWWIERGWQWWASIGFLGLSFLAARPNLSPVFENIFAGMAVAFLASAVISAGPKIRRWLKRG